MIYWLVLEIPYRFLEEAFNASQIVFCRLLFLLLVRIAGSHSDRKRDKKLYWQSLQIRSLLYCITSFFFLSSPPFIFSLSFFFWGHWSKSLRKNASHVLLGWIRKKNIHSFGENCINSNWLHVFFFCEVNWMIGYVEWIFFSFFFYLLFLLYNCLL